MADGDVIKMLVQLEATAQQMIQEINRGDAAVAKTSTSIDRNLSKVDQAFDRVGRNASTLQQAVSGAFSAIGAGNLAAAGSIAGLVALTNSTIDYAKEVKNLSALSNASVEEFQRYAYGAKSVGVEQEKLADIFKDTTDRVGEFLARGSGEMADFFKEIAPQIGLTADAFKGLSGPQALQLYYSSLEKAGVGQQQITTYMEQMADEATALVPLLRSGGAGFKELGDRAETAGAVISAFNIDRLINAKQSFKDLQETFSGFTNQIVIGLLPTIENVNEKLISLRDNGAAKQVGETIGFLAENVDILATALGVKLAAAFTRYGLQAVVSGVQATKAVMDNVAATKAAAIVKADDAAASAQAAAARLSEASATLASAKALEANTSARAAELLATREQLAYQTQLAAGTVDAARYSTTLAAVEKEVEVAKRESAKASAALTAATTAEAAARNRDTAATVANTAAQAEAASAKNLLARAAGGLVGLLGGPVGMIALAAGVGAAFLTMGGNAKTATTSMDDLKRSIADVRKEFLALAPAQRHAELTAKIKEQEQVTEEADEAYKGLLGSLKQQLGGTVAGRLATELDEARLKSGDLTDTITSFQKRFGLSDKQVASMRDAAKNVYELDERTKSLSARVAEYRQQLNATNVETKANTDTNVEGTQAGQKALEALQKQLATLQDKTAVEAANRVITENNIDTQSDLAKQLRATAAEIDNQKASDEAAKKSKTEASSAASKAASEAEKQREALKTLSDETRIAVEKADGLTASYVAGKDSLYELTLQERVQQELLKTGKDKLEEVTAAVKARMDAEARRDINKATRDLQLETSALLAQGVATLQGTTSLEAYNLERAKTEILAGRNAEALTKETAAYIEAMDQRNQALKISQQLSSVEGIMDRLKPEAKLLRDYTKEVDALTLAMKNNPDAAAEYAESLRLLGLEYEQNKAKATAWGQFTEGAVDRVDDAFADAWKNIDKGFDGFATNLKDGFKQLLAELAHMAITKPIVMQIGASLGVGGLSASQNSKGILGLFDNNSSGGGTDYSSLFQYGKSAYDFLSGTGANLYNAYQSGGLSGVYDYGASSIAGYFGSSAASAAGSSLTTAGANAAIGAQVDATAAGLGYLGNTASTGVSYTAASTASAASSAGLSTLGAAGYGIGGAIAGYQAAGLKGAATGAGGAVAGAYAGAALGSVVPIIGTAIGAAIGAMLGGMLGSSVWGGDWITKDNGLALGVTDGDFDGASFEYQKKKGGLFGKNKKRTRYSALDDATQSALAETYAATEDSVESLYKKLGVQLNDGILDGLNIGRTQISTKDKTNEEIQKELTAWFGTVADSMTSAINDATGAGVDGFNFETLTTFVNNLYSVNDAIRYLNVGLYDTSVAGGRLAESLAATAGGLQALQQNTATYFDQFFSDTEKANVTLDTVTRAFKSADAVLPDTREGFRKAVEALDLTTDAGQAMFTTLMSLAGQADTYYDVLEQRSNTLAQSLAQAQSAMLSSALTNLQRAVQRQQTALSAAYNAQVEGLNTSLSTSQGVMSSLTTMTSGLASALKTLQGQSDAAKAVLYQQAQATLVSAAAIARAGGSIAGLAGIDDALAAVTGNDASRYSSWDDFARDQGRSLVLIDELNSAAGGQLDQATASYKAIQEQIELAKKQFDMESAKLQGQIDLAQAQIDGINGIDNRLLTVNEALAEILKAISTASPDGTGTKNADAIIDAAYRAALGRSADAAGAAYWKQQLASGAVNSNNLSTAIAAAGAANAAAAPSQVTSAYASLLGRVPTAADMAYWTGQVANGGVHDVYAAIKAAAQANGQIPAFANGGNYLGGTAIVGEFGPEVIDFDRPGRIFNARQSAGMLSAADMSGVMSILAQVLAAIGITNEHLWYINDRTRATADNTEVLRDQAMKEEIA